MYFDPGADCICQKVVVNLRGWKEVLYNKVTIFRPSYRINSVLPSGS